jgi:glutamyl-tRNA synthetase
MTLEHALASRTYLVGHSLSLADLALFGALGFPAQMTERHSVLTAYQELYPTATRWVSMMAALPAIQKATQLAMGVNGTDEVIFTEATAMLDPLEKGMNLLEGAIPGQVVTRFPPEPSGYLHVGHAKAVLLNDYYARRYKGRLIVRFDDTNPSKEKEEYQQSIVEDLGLLGVKPDVVTFTSDYFEAIHGYALRLIADGLAYMDDTPQEQMKIERGDRVESKHRNQTKEDAKAKFLVMCSGSADGSTWCLRAKIDMSSNNGTLRDPVLYRQNLTAHHRSGTTYKAYPTYDLACPIVDSLEGVTHALRTTEYNDRDEQYQWILKALDLRRVRIHAFSRVNFVYTLLSKRKLAWFVEQGLVSGWGDARFPTVRGVVRRGVNVQALRTFIYSQGASRRVVNMEWTKFWAENKKELDKTAKRFMAIDKSDNATLVVTNAPSVDDNAYLETTYHPKDPSLGTRALRIAQQVLLETVDVEGITVGENIVLLRWGK